MTLTTHDIKQRLKMMDEVSVMELLQLTSEDLVNRFEDVIELLADDIEKELEEDNLYYIDGGEGEYDEWEV